ncbi:MAG: TIGR00730 family Rossman fold protein [Bacteroidota bacterium]
MKKIESISVFCGSSFGADPLFRIKAESLGKLLADEKIALVFGGSRLGLMGVVADAAHSNNGIVKGVIPEYLFNKGIEHKDISELIVTKNMSDRKNLIIEMSDAFIALPGGYGTLDEITEVLSLNQLSMIDKPCALLNVSGFFDFYLKQLDHTVEQKMLRPEHRNMLMHDGDEKKLLEKIKNYKAAEIGKWY